MIATRGLTWTSFSSLRIRGAYDFQKPEYGRKGEEARFRIRRLIDPTPLFPRSDCWPVNGDDGVSRVELSPLYSRSHARFIIKRVFYGSAPPRWWSSSIERVWRVSIAFEEVVRLANNRWTQALRYPDGYRRFFLSFFLFFYDNRKCFEPR